MTQTSKIDRDGIGGGQQTIAKVYAYAKKYDIRRIILLYPAVDFFNDKMSYSAKDNVEVKIFFVDLLNMATTISQLQNLLDTWN